MNVVIKCCLFVLRKKESVDIRKSDEYQIQLLVDEKQQLIQSDVVDDEGIKETIRKKIESVIGTKQFHLEQVYTLGDKKFLKDKELDIIYLAIVNEEFLQKKLKGYQLVNFNILNKDAILFDKHITRYKTKQKIHVGGIEYIHDICTSDLKEEKKLLEVLIAYKYLKSRIDNTDILFKFLPEKFALEAVRQVYEMITEKEVDKSNFRKRIIRYVEPLNEVMNRGYRPTQLYKFRVDQNDIWI